MTCDVRPHLRKLWYVVASCDVWSQVVMFVQMTSTGMIKSLVSMISTASLYVLKKSKMFNQIEVSYTKCCNVRNMLKAITDFWIHQNLLKYWFTFQHFVMDYLSNLNAFQPNNGKKKLISEEKMLFEIVYLIKLCLRLQVVSIKKSSCARLLVSYPKNLERYLHNHHQLEERLAFGSWWT